jgi:hypothetical protein
MKVHCAFCCHHTGLIVYGFQHVGINQPHVPGKPEECDGCYEVFAPCPFCDKGREIEEHLYGDEGYWQGNQPLPADVKETCTCHQRTLSNESNLQRIRELTARVKQHLARESDRQTTYTSREIASAIATRDAARQEPEPVPDNGEIGTLL